MRTKKTQPASRQEAVFKALGDASRLQIMGLLTREEMNAMEILAKVSLAQSTLSHHMSILCEAGILHARRQGKSTIYSIRRDTIMEMIGWGEAFLRMMDGEEIPDMMNTRREKAREDNVRAESEREEISRRTEHMKSEKNTEKDPLGEAETAAEKMSPQDTRQEQKEFKKKKDKKQKKKKDKKKEKDKSKKKKDKK